MKKYIVDIIIIISLIVVFLLAWCESYIENKNTIKYINEMNKNICNNK